VRAAGLALVLAFSWANRAGCCWLAGHAPYTVRKALPPSPPEAGGPPPTPELRAAVLGDFGDDTCQQRAVARGLAASHRRAPFDLVVQTGDNLYECGPDASLPGAAACAFAADENTVPEEYRPPADPRFRTRFEAALEPLARDGRPVPVWLALGNHDVSSGRNCLEGGLPPERIGRVRACLEVAHRSPHWRMPARHYLRDEGPARFVFLDTNLLAGEYGGFSFDDEVAFFREATRGCDARPCFVVGHHPPASAGGHGGEEGAAGADRVRRLQEAASGRIAAWLGGHDHDLQHLRAAAGYDVFVSGNGSRWRDERFERVGPAGAQLFFASTAWGHAVLEVRGRSWSVRFEGADGEPLHCCRAEHPGACQPVACGLPAAGPARPAPAR
jgi:3',5'-cyclic AMP phosphodiesterase CpdA